MYWIVGKKGMLAQALAQKLKEKSVPFIATSSSEVDITNKEEIKKFLQTHSCQYVINTAAMTHVDLAEDNPEKAFAINAEGPKNLAIACNEKKAKLIHISTDYVFDGCKDEPYVETDGCQPLNVYGMTKLYGEQNVESESDRFCIIRTSSLYGPFGVNFPERIKGLLTTKASFSVVKDQIASPTNVFDLVDAILHLKDEEGIIHFANHGAVSRFEWAELIFDLCRKDKKLKVMCKEINPIHSHLVQSVAMRPLYTELSTAKYSSLTKKHPRDWKVAFAEYWESVSCS